MDFLNDVYTKATGKKHGNRSKNMAEWERPEVQEWAKGAEEVQQHLGRILGKRMWDIFDESEEVYLQNKVGFALFGPPGVLEDEEVGYTKKQLKRIGKVCKAIKKQTKRYENKEQIPVAFIFNITNIPDEPLVPVIRMPKHDVKYPNSYLFIDSQCRVYKSWSNYLKTNKLHKCLMIFPKDGVYKEEDDKVQLERRRSPGWFTKQTNQTLKTADTLMSLSFAALCLAALFSPASIPTAPILVGVLTRSILAIGQTINKLVDRKRHGQTLGLNSQEARGCWVGLASETLSTATGGLSAATLLMTKASHTAFLVGNAGVRALRITKVAVDGISVLNRFTGYAAKIIDDEEVTLADSVQMASSILFFTHAVIPVKVAGNVVKALKDAKMPTVLSEVLQHAGIDQKQGGSKGMSITHVEDADQLVQLLVKETVSASPTEPDSPTIEKNFVLTEKEKFINNILISSTT